MPRKEKQIRLKSREEKGLFPPFSSSLCVDSAWRDCTSLQAMNLQTITRRGYLGAAHLTVAYITGENLLMHADLDKNADIIHMHAKSK